MCIILDAWKNTTNLPKTMWVLKKKQAKQDRLGSSLMIPSLIYHAPVELLKNWAIKWQSFSKIDGELMDHSWRLNPGPYRDRKHFYYPPCVFCKCVVNKKRKKNKFAKMIEDQIMKPGFPPFQKTRLIFFSDLGWIISVKALQSVTLENRSVPTNHRLEDGIPHLSAFSSSRKGLNSGNPGTAMSRCHFALEESL